MTDVVVIDDDPLVRAGFRAIVDSEPDLHVVGEAGDGAEALGLVRRHTPDVVIMDVRMPTVNGIDATRHLLESLAVPPKVLVVTTFTNDSYIYDALRVGATGFLLKRAPAAEIVRAVRVVATGESLLFPDAVRSLLAAHTTRVVPQPGLGELTDREQQVLRYVAMGLTNAEIAGQLFLGVETVKTHVGNVLSKLNARDRTQAVITAYESGFITPGGAP